MVSPLRGGDTIARHQKLLRDRERTEAYRRAIAETVKPGDSVVDLGAGTGVLSFFACRAGAERVYAIEAGPAVELARILSRANGYEDRVRLLRQTSDEVQLPERADVLVTETMGCAGLEEGMLGWVLDGRERMLKPGGTIMPALLEISAAPVEAGEFYDGLGLWAAERYGLDLSAVKPHALNTLWRRVVEEGDCLARPGLVASIDLSCFTSPRVEGTTSFTITRRGRVHAMACWFRARLSRSVTLTNAPPVKDPGWSHLMLPLERELEVEPGDELRAAITSFDGREWRWETVLSPKSGGGRTHLDQATIGGFPFSLDSLRRNAPDYRPSLSPRGRALRFLLEGMDGRARAADLERRLSGEFPEFFPSSQAAARFVRELIAWISE